MKIQNKFVRNFLKGMGSILELWPDPPRRPNAQSNDADNLRKDWEMIGSDIYKTMNDISHERKE